VNRHYSLALTTLVLALLLPGTARANARLVSVVPRDGGCVGEPAGRKIETWPVQPGRVYTLTFDKVHECGHNGTDPTIGVLLVASGLQALPVTARKRSAGEYEFDYLVPAGACQELQLRYGVTNGRVDSGYEAGRHDDGSEQAHLRACTFQPGCTNPTTIICGMTPTLSSSWGQLKSIYR
jgi:hypothetical protein